jgi:hypothetical protein
MEISHVRRQLQAAMDRARERAQQRRQRTGEAERTYAAFLETIAVPVARQVANALKVENFAFTVSTPGNGVRLASDRSRHDYVDVALDTSGDSPRVMARVSRTRGSRTLDNEYALKDGALPDAITEDDFLEFLLGVLEPWLER